MTACPKCGYDEAATVARSWTFLVDRDPPSLNSRMVNAGRWASARYARERDMWQWEFKAVRLLQRIPIATSKRRVTLTRVVGGRQKQRDRDNLIGGQKVVLDAMVREGLIVDDSAAFAEVHYAEERGGPVGLRALIEEFA